MPAPTLLLLLFPWCQDEDSLQQQQLHSILQPFLRTSPGAARRMEAGGGCRWIEVRLAMHRQFADDPLLDEGLLSLWSVQWWWWLGRSPWKSLGCGPSNRPSNQPRATIAAAQFASPTDGIVGMISHATERASRRGRDNGSQSDGCDKGSRFPMRSKNFVGGSQLERAFPPASESLRSPAASGESWEPGQRSRHVAPAVATRQLPRRPSGTNFQA
ncbi:unnamed protein product [Lampetra fluviatilis]